MSKTALLLAVALSVAAADQLTKYLAVSHLTDALDGRSGLARASGWVTQQNLDDDPRVPNRVRPKLRDVVVVPNYWNHRYVENPGAAWGMFGKLPDKVRGKFFLVVSVVALLFIAGMYRRIPARHRFMQVALAMVMGGAIGNFTDRLLRGYVIDFIDWHWRNQPGMHWPTFNIADVGISVGVAMMVLDGVVLWLRRPRKPVPVTAPEPEQPAVQQDAPPAADV